MKNIIATLSLCAAASIMASCTLTNEEKAERLIKDTLKDYLYHPNSYKPISTTVDSSFIDVSTIEPIMKTRNEISDLMSEIDEYEREIESAETSMDIYAPNGYSSQFSRGQYARAKKEKEEAQTHLDRYVKKLSSEIASLKENVAKFHKGEFTGWAVSHRFRSNNGLGTLAIPEEMIFFCDKEFTSCIGYEADKLNDFTMLLKAVDEATCDEDIMDFCKENSFPL